MILFLMIQYIFEVFLIWFSFYKSVGIYRLKTSICVIFVEKNLNGFLDDVKDFLRCAFKAIQWTGL